jgi:ferric-dicitrate binding protein FerR (iron transport regulator)
MDTQSQDQHYEAWKRQRQALQAASHLKENIMHQVMLTPALPQTKRSEAATESWAGRLKTSIFLLALLGGVGRYALILYFVLIN